MSFLSAVAIIVLIIVVIGVVVIVGHSKTTQYQSQFPQFQNIGGTVPAALNNILSQPSSASTSDLAMLAQSKLSNASQFSIKYNGSLSIQPSGALGAVTSINSPLYISESKYANNTKLSINATSIPILGSARIIYLAIANGTFTCTNFNSTAVSSGNYGKLLLGNSHTLTCIKSSSIGGINLASIARFNISSISNEGIQLNYQKEYQSIYKGIPCTYISGNMTGPASNGTALGTGEFGTCISDTYYMPLSLAMYFNGKQAYISMNINETSIGNYSNQSYINSLPGPVV